MGSFNEFLYQKAFVFVATFWLYVSRYVVPLLGFITTYVFRFNNSTIISEENNEKDSNRTEQEPEVMSLMDSQNHMVGEEEEEPSKFSFQFKFPTYEELKRKRENGDFVNFEPLSPSANKYEFLSGKSYGGYIDEPEVVSFKVEEINEDTKFGYFEEKDMVDDEVLLLDNDFKLVHHEEEEAPIGIQECFISSDDTWTLAQENAQEVNSDNFLEGDENVNDEVSLKDFSMESDPESSSSSNFHSVMSRLVDSFGDGFLTDGEFELDTSTDVDEEDDDMMEQLQKFEEEEEEAENFNSNFLSEKDFHGKLDKSKSEEFHGKNDKPELKDESNLDYEDPNKLESLWEHQELIDQLKMELKKVRATGLPTILEESESPKIMEDLKPWKIEEKFQNENSMGELHKFYKSYRDRMRKFDILNYQKMYAIGFLQLKSPVQSNSSHKSSVPELTSFLSPNLCPCKRKKNENDPTMKFIKELQSDLEVVYVGQMCLSWEILHWQYGKALDLWESDPRGVRRFNEVAGEFQQFQVLMQRFTEDEHFQGPRVQNYVKNRCVLRNLLQVPVIREDSFKNKTKARLREKGEYAITSDMLVEILEESIRSFWRFVRADKGCNCYNVIVKGLKGASVELQNDEDSDLFKEVQKNLQKKERKLRDLLRSGNCILRRFQKSPEDNSDQVLYFFSQVDMKLVSRVLNMSRLTTDQLLWCHNKLSKISFINSKIHVEPSFLLFPC